MGSLALAAGVPAKNVGERLGHSGIQITLDMYTHTTPIRRACGEPAPPFNVPQTMFLPPGWRAEVWTRLVGPRFAAYLPA